MVLDFASSLVRALLLPLLLRTLCAAGRNGNGTGAVGYDVTRSQASPLGLPRPLPDRSRAASRTIGRSRGVGRSPHAPRRAESPVSGAGRRPQTGPMLERRRLEKRTGPPLPNSGSLTRMVDRRSALHRSNSVDEGLDPPAETQMR